MVPLLFIEASRLLRICFPTLGFFDFEFVGMWFRVTFFCVSAFFLPTLSSPRYEQIIGDVGIICIICKYSLLVCTLYFNWVSEGDSL